MRTLVSLLLSLVAIATSLEARGDGVRLFGQVDLGLAWLDQDAGHYGRFSGLDSDGFTPLVDFRLERRSDTPQGWYLRLDGERVGLASRRVSARAGRRARQAIELDWRELPGWTLSGGRTPFRLEGDRFVLPGDWSGLDSTAGLPGQEDAYSPVEIRSRRKRLDLAYWQSFRDRWRVEVEASEQRREGARLLGAIFGYSGGNPRGMLLPAVVDDTTQRIESRLIYADPSGHEFGLAWLGSFYRNRRGAVAFDNPFNRHPQWAPGTGFPDGSGQVADYPDNSAHQLRAFGSWKLGEQTRLGADLAVGQMQQNDWLLPYTLNPALQVDQPLPVMRLDAEMRTSLANLRLATRWFDRLNLVVNYRYDDRDNRTPALAWQIVGADSQDQRSQPASRVNLPYSLRRQKLDIDGHWRLAGRQRLVAGLDFMREDRDDFAEVAQLDQWGATAGWRGRLGRVLRLRVDAEHSIRRFEEYEGRAPYRAGRLPGTVDPDDFENHPELRKYNVSDRDRTGLNVRMDVQPTMRLSLGLGGRYFRDDHDDARFGLDRAEVRTINADFGWQFSRHVSVSGLMSRDRYTAEQSGRDWPGSLPQLAFDPSRDWWAGHDDRIETASLSLVWQEAGFIRRALSRMGLDGSADLGADFIHVRARGAIDVRAAGALTVEPLPDTLSWRQSWAVWARLRTAAGWRVQLRVEHEDFRSRDYASDGVDIDSVASLLLLGQPAPDYSIVAVLATVGYRF